MRLAVLVVVALAADARAERGEFVGSATCGACHPKELAAWQASAHAHSADRLGAAARRCFACHGTGDAPAGQAYWPEVGCEACHGPGEAYATDDVMRDLPLARALGLRDVSARATICASCHRAITRLVPIDLSKPAHPLS